MSDEGNQNVPASPEVEPQAVREELEQDEITHQGKRRQVTDIPEDAGQHMGAVDGETVPVRAPMEGPSHVTEGEDSEPLIDPRDELTPG